MISQREQVSPYACGQTCKHAWVKHAHFDEKYHFSRKIPKLET